MDGVVSNEVIKRRLPPWMLGVDTADKGRVGDSKNNNVRDIDDGCRSREDPERVKKRGGRRPKSRVATQKKREEFSDGLELEEVEEEREESAALVLKCGDKKRTKRKLDLYVEDAPKKKKQKGKAKRNFKSSEDAITGGCLDTGEDEDLTVEDLMIFAKECVQENIGTREVEPMKEEISAENQFGDIVQSGNSIDVQENKRLSERQEVSFSGVTTGNVNVTREGGMSGDPTQDMLDLFLGPLLKKTREKEKKVDLTTDEMDLNFEMKRQNKGGALGEERATIAVAKKRSSLRDRVAMFLD